MGTTTAGEVDGRTPSHNDATSATRNGTGAAGVTTLTTTTGADSSCPEPLRPSRQETTPASFGTVANANAAQGNDVLRHRAPGAEAGGEDERVSRDQNDDLADVVRRNMETFLPGIPPSSPRGKGTTATSTTDTRAPPAPQSPVEPGEGPRPRVPEPGDHRIPLPRRQNGRARAAVAAWLDKNGLGHLAGTFLDKGVDERALLGMRRLAKGDGSAFVNLLEDMGLSAKAALGLYWELLGPATPQELEADLEAAWLEVAAAQGLGDDDGDEKTAARGLRTSSSSVSRSPPSARASMGSAATASSSSSPMTRTSGWTRPTNAAGQSYPDSPRRQRMMQQREGDRDGRSLSPRRQQRFESARPGGARGGGGGGGGDMTRSQPDGGMTKSARLRGGRWIVSFFDPNRSFHSAFLSAGGGWGEVRQRPLLQSVIVVGNWFYGSWCDGNAFFPYASCGTLRGCWLDSLIVGGCLIDNPRPSLASW